MPDARKDEYCKYLDYPDLSYNCISYLVRNNDLIWKLLYYTDADAWKDNSSHPNLTTPQKGALIYGGQPNASNYRVFMDVGMDTSITDQICLLRVAPLELDPVTYIYGNVSMTFEVYSHYQINHLSAYKTRVDWITQQLIETFNGAEVGGLGRLYYDQKASRKTRTVTIGAIPFKGKATVMCNYVM